MPRLIPGCLSGGGVGELSEKGFQGDLVISLGSPRQVLLGVSVCWWWMPRDRSH